MNIVEHLKDYGLSIHVVDGYAYRGNGRSFKPRGVLCHHTATSVNSVTESNVKLVTNGRSDLAGPLCNFFLSRAGEVYIVALGSANHAGTGILPGIPRDAGNSYLYGIEADNNGTTEPWSEHMLDAYATLCAALLDWMDQKNLAVWGHKEYAPTRKIDPDFDMTKFRQRVSKMRNLYAEKKDIKISNLVVKTSHPAVVKLKKALAARGYFKGSMDNYYGRGLRKAYKKYKKKELGRAKANGKPDKKSLESLGFRVLP